NMSDDEIRDVVLEHLRESPNVSADDVQVAVRDGHVTLSGRVGTDAEAQVAEAVLDDVLGLDEYTNDLWSASRGAMSFRRRQTTRRSPRKRLTSPPTAGTTSRAIPRS